MVPSLQELTCYMFKISVDIDVLDPAFAPGKPEFTISHMLP